MGALGGEVWCFLDIGEFRVGLPSQAYSDALREPVQDHQLG